MTGRVSRVFSRHPHPPTIAHIWACCHTALENTIVGVRMRGHMSTWHVIVCRDRARRSEITNEKSDQALTGPVSFPHATAMTEPKLTHADTEQICVTAGNISRASPNSHEGRC